MNILDLDIGNSRVKWRVDGCEGITENGQLPQLNTRVERVRVSTVAASRTQLDEQIQQHFGVSPEYAQSTPILAGVSNGYQDPGQLGVDRWLAVVAAWSQCHRPLIVFDLGTAMTADFVDRFGAHLGGYIVPGLSALKTTLGQTTQHVNVSDGQKTAPRDLIGTNTQSAVELGTVQMCLGWIKSCVNIGEGLVESSPKLYLTGGSVEQVLEHLEYDYVVEPHLVLDGLAIALP